MKRLGILLVMLGLLSACGPVKQVSILVRMMPEQERFLKDSILPPFEKKMGCKIRVESFQNPLSVDTMLSPRQKELILVKTPFEATRHFAEEGLFAPLDSLMGARRLSEMQERYFLMPLSAYQNRLYYLPRKFETRIMLYRKSKVAEALKAWGDHRESVDSVLKSYNGQGLPSGYTLESDPNEWDFFDIFTLGWVWAHADSGPLTPKIAHRAKHYSGTCQRLVDRAFSMGATPEKILQMGGAEVEDAFFWEALYEREHVYNPKMITEAWSGADIWKGFKSEDVYLAFMTQLDAFFIHGDDAGRQPGYLGNPDDLGFAVMPQGVSFDLDRDGKPLRSGSHGITTGGWWWGIPRNTPDPALSIALAEWILSSEVQADEASRFGMIPVRKDILGDISLLFGRTWIADIYQTSLKQLVFNAYQTVPLHPHYSDVESAYLDAWDDVIMQNHTGPDNGGMKSFVRNRLSAHQTKVKEIAFPVIP